MLNTCSYEILVSWHSHESGKIRDPDHGKYKYASSCAIWHGLVSPDSVEGAAVEPWQNLSGRRPAIYITTAGCSGKGASQTLPAHLPSRAAEHVLTPSFRWPSFPWVSLFSRKQNMSLGLSLHLDPSPLLMGFKNAVLCCDCVPGE